MLQETTQRLLNDNALHSDVVLKNAVVESCVVHARSLTKFIYPGDARPDDITSDDYVTDKVVWAKARGEKPPPILETLTFRTNKEIAHLTTARLGADDPAKRWPLQEIVGALQVLLKTFAAHAAPDRLHPEVSGYIVGLRPPIETTTHVAYNPRSTELETRLKYPTDVGTTAPIIRPKP